MLIADSEDFEVKKIKFCDQNLENLINLKRLEFCESFCEETGWSEHSYPVYIADFLINIFRFKKRMPLHYSYMLEEFLKIDDFLAQNKNMALMKELYKKMILFTADEYKLKHGKTTLRDDELRDALLDWAGGY